MIVEIFFDGAANNLTHQKTGKAPMGVGIYARSGGVEIFSKSYYVGFGTSMDAEWSAFVLAMKVALLITKKYRDKIVKIRLFNDNKVVIDQYNIAHHNKENYRYFYDKVIEIQKQIRSNCFVRASWIPREQNEIADALSKEARIYGENLLKGFEITKINFCSNEKISYL